MLFGDDNLSSGLDSLFPGVTPALFGEIEARGKKHVRIPHSLRLQIRCDFVEVVDQLLLQEIALGNIQNTAVAGCMVHRVVLVRYR